MRLGAEGKNSSHLRPDLALHISALALGIGLSLTILFNAELLGPYKDHVLPY